MKSIQRGLGILASCAACAACGGNGSGPSSSGGPDQPTGTVADGGVILDDGQIAGVAIAADNGEVDRANWAVGLLVNPGVRAFASGLASDGATLNKAIASFGISVQPSGLQSKVNASMQATMAELSICQRSTLDVDFLRTELAAQTAFRDIVESTLVPDATNVEFQGYLVGTFLPYVESHRTAAQSLLTELGADNPDDAGTEFVAW